MRLKSKILSTLGVMGLFLAPSFGSMDSSALAGQTCGKRCRTGTKRIVVPIEEEAAPHLAVETLRESLADLGVERREPDSEEYSGQKAYQTELQSMPMYQVRYEASKHALVFLSACSASLIAVGSNAMVTQIPVISLYNQVLATGSGGAPYAKYSDESFEKLVPHVAGDPSYLYAATTLGLVNVPFDVVFTASNWMRDKSSEGAMPMTRQALAPTVYIARELFAKDSSCRKHWAKMRDAVDERELRGKRAQLLISPKEAENNIKRALENSLLPRGVNSVNQVESVILPK
jgi:hypothetical protein